MNEEMKFPKTFEEFIKQYSFFDKQQIYTNGSELIQVFRIKQWEEHKEKENQELKEKYLNAVADYETTMFEKEQLNSLVNSCQEEIRRLKKQLEELELQNFNLREDIMIKKMSLPNEEIKDKTFFDLYDMPSYEELKKQLKEYKRLGFKHLNDKCNKLENQQKEFIKYLEDEIKQINPKILDDGELNLRLDDIKYTQYLTYKEILQKYKEIIGVSDDKTN